MGLLLTSAFNQRQLEEGTHRPTLCFPFQGKGKKKEKKPPGPSGPRQKRRASRKVRLEFCVIRIRAFRLHLPVWRIKRGGSLRLRYARATVTSMAPSIYVENWQQMQTLLLRLRWDAANVP